MKDLKAAGAAAAKDPVVIIDSNASNAIMVVDEEDEDQNSLESAARRFTEAVSITTITTTTITSANSKRPPTAAAVMTTTRHRTRSGGSTAGDSLGNSSNNSSSSKHFSNNNNKTSSSTGNNNNNSHNGANVVFKSSSTNSNNKKATPPPPPPLPAALETLLRLMDEADYEVECDPYRGMDIVALASARQARAVAATDVAANINNSNSPWRLSCSFGSVLLMGQGGLEKKKEFSDFTNKVRSQYNSNSAGNNNISKATTTTAAAAAAAAQAEIAQIQAQQLVEMACQNSCPTLQQWTLEAILKDNKDKPKKKAAAAAAKKKKNKRTKKSATDTATTTTIIIEDNTTDAAAASASAITETTTTTSVVALLGQRPPDKEEHHKTSYSRNEIASSAGGGGTGGGGIIDVSAVATVVAAAAAAVDNDAADSTQGVAGDNVSDAASGNSNSATGGGGDGMDDNNSMDVNSIQDDDKKYWSPAHTGQEISYPKQEHVSEQSSSHSTKEQQQQQQQQGPENKNVEEQQQQTSNAMLVKEEQQDQKPTAVDGNDDSNNDNNNNDDDLVEKAERQWQLHKKQHLQQQREEHKSGQQRLLCRCDYNPFCLGTLGGVMNEVIQRGLKLTENSDTNNNAAAAAAAAANNCNNGLAVTTSPAVSSNSNSSRENDDDKRKNDINVDVDDDDDDEVLVVMQTVSSTKAAAATPGDADDELEIEIIQDDNDDNKEKKEEDFPSYCTPATLDRLRNIRRSKLIDTNRVRKHLKSTLKGLVSSSSTMDQYIQRLRYEHDRLVFQNHLVSTATISPTTAANINDPDRFRLSIPPGISNLGATCYLNTQLQCLAQNTNFVQGIFSWRKQQQRPQPEASLNPIDATMASGDKSNEQANQQQEQQQQPEDRMTAVLSRFQRILIGMYAGPHAKINTREFSNSLGLDHYEQQDPNEFSRLLLERIHESFQTTTPNPATDSEQEQQQHNLAELLPNLFQGCMRYETTCLYCHNKSTRDEEFMDINLPIVRPPSKADEKSAAASKSGCEKSSSSSTSGGQQQTIMEAFAAGGNINDSDTNVQFCLDSYCGAERLEGDNQYYCSQCECKRDAERQLKFQKLPPCLNVQLSRYIFDMQTLSKKKAMDKVLLPTELTLYTKQTTPTTTATSRKKRGGANVVDDDDEKLCERRYILCAVMKHQGKLATSGHYVAEAMDWRTGQWFEFNDEKVTWISECSNSYDPSSIAHNMKNSHQETEILNGKKTTAANINKRKRGAKNNSTAADKTMAANGISTAGSQDAYNMYYVDEDFLAQSVHESLRQERRQSNDGMMGVVDRMAGERSKVYASLQQACFDDCQNAKRMEDRRNFILNDMFAGHPSAHTVGLESADPPPVWVEADFLRRFLSCRDGLEAELKTGNSIVSDVLQQELVLCEHKEPGLHPREARRGKLLTRPMYDALVARLKVEGGELIGKTWSDDDMEDPIISLTKNLICAECSVDYQMELYERLVILSNALTLYNQLDNKTAECDTSYEPGTTFEKEEERYVYIVSKKFATAFRNRVSGIMKQVAPADLTCVPDMGFTSNSAVESIAEGIDAIGSSELYFKDITDPDFDVRINSNITCKHGRLTQKKRSFRYCSWGEWNELKELFPEAIMHRIRKVASGDAVEVSDSCPDCEAEGNAVDNLSVRLCGLAKFCKSSECKALDCEGIAKMTPGTTVRLVHSSELNAFQKFVADFKRKKGNENIESQLRKVLAPQNKCFVSRLPEAKSARTLSAAESKRLSFLSSWTRPLICKEHSLPIRAAVVRDSPSGSDSTTVAALRDRVSILDEGTYQSFVSQLAAVAVVMEPSKEALSDTDTDEEVNVFLAEASDLLDRMDIHECYPKSELVVHRSSASPETHFTFTSNNLATMLTVCGGFCEDTFCNEEFRAWENQEELLGSSTAASARNGLGTAASDPIAVDSDIDDRKGSDTFILRVVEADGDADNEAILMALAQYSAPPSADSTLRRSSRRKKPRMPIGVLMNEQNVEADMCNNAAALRLLLFESLNGLNGSFELDHRLTLAIIPPTPPSKEPVTWDVEDSLATVAATSQVEPLKLVDISFLKNESTLAELCQDVLPDNEAKATDFKPKEHLILVRQSTKEKSAKECCPEEHLMDFLIGLSNVLSKDTKQSDSGDRKRRTRFQERGFTGTFLSSAKPLSKAASTNGEKDSDGGTDKEDIIVTVSNESKVDGSEARKKKPRFDKTNSGGLSAIVELTDDSKESSPASPSSTKSSSTGDGSGSRNGVEPSAIHAENDIGNSDPGDRVFQVVGAVLMQNEGVDQSKAYDSASWAVSTNPKIRDISELACHAYAKYLDDSVH